MAEKKFSNYLAYAIGEIVLLVIGILIALSINNWNDKRKDIALEKRLLNNLAESLENNCDQLESRIQSIKLYRTFGEVYRK